MKPAKETGSSEQRRAGLLSSMLLSLFLLALFCALWWAALWLALPVEWLQGSLPSIVLVHVGPPILAISALWAGKRAWGWRKARVKRLADERETAGKKATQDAAYASHLTELARLHAHLECRSVWQEHPLKVTQEIGGEAVLLSLLQQVFSKALSQCEALAWLPVYVLSGRRDAEESAAQLKLIQQAMQHAMTMTGVENLPPQPECIPLPGSGNLADRLISLFDNNPALPAAILVGIDSPLG
ncbi:MAG: hypothetical protein FWG52_01770, partial [Proteobacteria bacterium]|nr:hypothetical protein [Pseudomonadota bacterium]